MYRRYSRRKPQQPEHVPAAIAMLADAKFTDMPHGGFAGEMLLAPAPQPQQQPIPSLTPPAPDWQAELAERAEREAAQPEPPPPAPTIVEQMLADGEIEWPQLGLPAPPIRPLERFRGVDVDWRAEEKEAIERNKRAQLAHARKLLAEHEGEPSSLRVRIPPPPWATEDGAA